ncbi:dihydrolipoamide acetyltransferase family protein [Blattabacterium cuenoti]|uniref:dihydrolipoamide acetyltransferase family protein n=1 Tax=Blattabacterium cuenoti TaxID=1653831 RepID=UPI00163C627E|nr:dihydrolipoamide acetyltransferase family protein [Blattabacterium cuenoti]
MSEYNLILPAMGESIAEATIIRWLKEEGDTVKKEEILVEIATDKVDSEVYSPVNGILKKKLFLPNEVAKIGSSIAVLEIKNKTKIISIPTTKEKKKRFYSPLVRTIAHKEGINFYELETIKGTGINDRVTKEDILKYIRIKKNRITPTTKKIVKNYHTTNVMMHDCISSSNEEILEMDRMRKIIAEHMVKSKNIAAHVTSFVEADVTNIVKWRENIKESFQKDTGEKLTLMSVFVECVVKAIKDLPMINISVVNEGKNIVKKRNIHIGLATALPNGNLIVPVIKHADSYSLGGLVKIINDLIKRAKSNKLKPEETQGGTYTISNIGSFGNLFGTPIIHQPQVAIMAIGLIQKKLSIIETPEGDCIGIRHKIYLSHSYDHRVIDGVLGGSFAKKVALYLEKFNYYTKI